MSPGPVLIGLRLITSLPTDSELLKAQGSLEIKQHLQRIKGRDKFYYGATVVNKIKHQGPMFPDTGCRLALWKKPQAAEYRKHQRKLLRKRGSFSVWYIP